MSLQLSVSQQNHELFEKIQFAVGSLANYAWLPSLLVERGQNLEEGILVQIGSCTEHEGDEVFGVWLSSEKEFWEFSVIISRETGFILEVEQFENVTQSVVVSAHVPGTGQSFGYLALQVLSGLRREPLNLS